MTMKYKDLVEKKPQLKEIAAKFGVKEIFVFGSLAGAEETSTSDVDLLIEMHADASALGVGGFQYEVEQLLQVSVDVVPTFAFSRIRDRAFVESIQAEAKPL